MSDVDVPFIEPHVSDADYEDARRRKLLRLVGRTFGPGVHWHREWGAGSGSMLSTLGEEPGPGSVVPVAGPLGPAEKGGLNFPDTLEKYRRWEEKRRKRQAESDRWFWWSDFIGGYTLTFLASFGFIILGAVLAEIPGGRWWSDLAAFGIGVGVPMVLGVWGGRMAARAERGGGRDTGKDGPHVR